MIGIFQLARFVMVLPLNTGSSGPACPVRATAPRAWLPPAASWRQEWPDTAHRSGSKSIRRRWPLTKDPRAPGHDNDATATVPNCSMALVRAKKTADQGTGSWTPARPCMPASRRKSRNMNRSSAPRHFMVPISRNRSVTAISWALTMPTTHTRRDRTTIHRCFGLLSADVSSGPKS